MKFYDKAKQAQFGGYIDPDMSQQMRMEDEAATLKQQEQADAANPIKLTAAQQVSQAAYQAVGAMNQQGTGPGPGFFGSTIGKIVIGVGVVAGLYVLGPVFTLVAAGVSRGK